MKTSKTQKLAYSILLAIIVFTTGFGCFSKEKIEEKAYNRIIKELQDNGNPIGMFGATWFMTQQEVKNLFSNAQQLNANTLVQARNLYDRPVQASYHFEDDRLLGIVVSFKEGFRSLEEFADAIYEIQDNLSLDYGQMPEPTLNAMMVSPTDGKWADQDVLESEKRMGRTTLVHKISIQNNGAGEQIIVFYGAAVD